MLDGLDSPAFSGEGKILWRRAMWSLLWFLWNRINSKTFVDKFASFVSFLGICSTYNLLVVHKLYQILL